MFATKVNLIGMVTGVSHEKLQVYHRWTACIMCMCPLPTPFCLSLLIDKVDITALIHTFPFIIGSIHHGQMESEWNTSSYYWTGVAALVPQVLIPA